MVLVRVFQMFGCHGTVRFCHKLNAEYNYNYDIPPRNHYYNICSCSKSKNEERETIEDGEYLIISGIAPKKVADLNKNEDVVINDNQYGNNQKWRFTYEKINKLTA